MLDTSTSFAPARALTRAPMCTADPADVVAADLALAGVQPGAHLDAERLHRVADRHGAADRSLRAVEHREEAVARRVHLAAPKAGELGPDDGVVRIEQRMPVTVTDLRGPARRVHDVGEQHRGENPIIGHFGLLAGEELGDLLEGLAPSRFNVVVPVAARQLNIFRAGYVLGDVPALRGRDDRVLGVVDDQRWHADCRKDRPHVQFRHERHQESTVRGARRQAFHPSPRARISSFHGMSGFIRC